MTGSQGPLTWEAFAPFTRAPIFAGIPLSGRLSSLRVTPADAGISILMLDGGAVFQAAALPDGASLSRAAQEIELSYVAATEEDSRIAGWISAKCREDVQPLTLWDVASDYWPITAAPRLTWALSRDSASLPPDVHSGEILRPDGTRTALTLVMGAPSTGQIAVSGRVATTPDLSADAGAMLHVRYYPIRWVATVSQSIDAQEPGSLSFDLTFGEWLR